MPTIGHIAWKELKTYFTSWMAYALIAGWLFMGAYIFLLLVSVAEQSNQFTLGPVYQNLVVVLLFVAPLITMRLLAEERSSGTMEMLFTSPLTEWQVTLGKFFGAWGFIGVMLVLTLHFPFFTLRYGSVDSGPIWGSYIALLCVGATLVSFGLFCSSLTESQVVAGFLTFSGTLVSWMLGWLSESQPGSDVASFISQWSVYSHFTPMMQGAIDTKDLIYFISVTFFFLFATVQVLESRKWR